MRGRPAFLCLSMPLCLKEGNKDCRFFVVNCEVRRRRLRLTCRITGGDGISIVGTRIDVCNDQAALLYKGLSIYLLESFKSILTRIPLRLCAWD